MTEVVQARLDPATQKILSRLVNQMGLTPSEVVREGLRVLAACRPQKPPRRIIGMGQFDSGVPDLATNKKHMRGFGR